jgi:hypothetical protein
MFACFFIEYSEKSNEIKVPGRSFPYSALDSGRRMRYNEEKDRA